MKGHDRIEILGLAVFTAVMMALVVSGQSTSAAAPVPGGCTISFSGGLTSLQLAPAGAWRLTSSGCVVSDRSGGVTRGTFTGNFSSGLASGVVSGTWSLVGGTQKVVASSAGFTLSLSTDQGVDQTPVLGSAFQGTLSGTGSPLMFTVGTVGQIRVR